MSNPPSETEGGAGPDKTMSGLFASMVMQNTNMALIFLGQAPHPQTGQTTQDLEHATYFIDQLEMLAVKTKGNLDKQEDALLKQSLTHLRLAFVEAVEHPLKTAPPAAAPATPPMDEQETPVTEPTLPGEKTAESESRKKFSKKY
jgi:K+-sensing histidine kinase KdpD